MKTGFVGFSFCLDGQVEWDRKLFKAVENQRNSRNAIIFPYSKNNPDLDKTFQDIFSGFFHAKGLKIFQSQAPKYRKHPLFKICDFCLLSLCVFRENWFPAASGRRLALSQRLSGQFGLQGLPVHPVHPTPVFPHALP